MILIFFSTAVNQNSPSLPPLERLVMQAATALGEVQALGTAPEFLDIFQDFILSGEHGE